MRKILATLLLALLAVTITVFGLTSCLDDPTETEKPSAPVDSGEELSDSGEDQTESDSESDEPATTYIITWMNGEDELGKTEVEENELPVYDGETPVKAADAQYTYTFNGWAPEIVAATEDATYTATYTETVNTYTVTWKDGDGNTLDTDEVAYGEVPAYTGETPTKTATAQYSYTWDNGWDVTPAAVTGDATYTATFTETVNNYTVTFNTNGGNEIAAASVPYGTASSALDDIIPTKAGYAFVKWQLQTGEDTYVDLDGTETVTENITVKAVWTANTYYVTFKNGEETVGEPVAYTVETASITEPAVPAKEGYTGAWETYDLSTVGGITVNAVYTPIVYTATIDRVVGDDEEVEFTIENRETVLAGITLTADTDEWAYSWAEDLPEVLALNNTQVFTETRAKKTYTITWKNEDGTTLETDPAVEYGATPEYNGETPTKATTADNVYTYNGWNTSVIAVTGNTTYTATYTSKATFAVSHSSESATTITIENNDDYFDTFSLYINNVKVADDISDDIVDGVYDFEDAGYCGDDYYFIAKVEAIKDEETKLSDEFWFKHLAAGVSVGYNYNGADTGNGNNSYRNNAKYCAIRIPLDSTKFDSNDTTIEYVNVAMEMKGVIGKNASGAQATGGMYFKPYTWGVANGQIQGTEVWNLTKGGIDYYSAFSSADWTVVNLRVPVQYAGSIYIMPYNYPSGFSTAVFVRNIVPDYETISADRVSPIQTAVNPTGVERGQNVDKSDCKAIQINFDASNFDTDDASVQWVNVTMKARGTIGKNANGQDCTGGIYMRAYSWFGKANGPIKVGNAAQDPYIVSGAASWFEICSSSDWMEVTIRIPVQYANQGYVLIHPFEWPNGFPITMEATGFTVNYTSISATR